MELTYEVVGKADMPLWEDLPEVAAESEPAGEVLETVYFDTPTLRLAGEGVALRRSAGGANPGWFLTAPTADGGTREVRLPLGRAVRTVPKALAAQVRVHARAEALGPVARTTVRRSRRQLLDGEGGLLARVIADDVSAESIGTVGGADGAEPGAEPCTAAWSEVEVEIVTGDTSLQRAVNKRLLAAGARRAASAMPVRRLLGEHLPDSAEATTPRTRGRSAAGEVVMAYLADQVRAIKALDPGVRRDEPEAVHDMRVAIRRIRSALRVFPVFDEDRTRPISDELRWLGTVLGGARDHEVLQVWLDDRLGAVPSALVRGPVRTRIDEHFRSARRAARRELLTELDGPRYFALLDALDAVLADPPLADGADRPADALLPDRVRRTFRRLNRAAGHAMAQAEGPERDVACHEARKIAKRTRYAAEVLQPTLGKKNRRRVKLFTAGMKELQDVLGARQDTVVAREALLDAADKAHQAGENSFTFGVLHERGAAEARHADTELPGTWRRASAPERLRWLA